MPKSNFEKAAGQFGKLTGTGKRLRLVTDPHGYELVFLDRGDLIEAQTNFLGKTQLEVEDHTTVGDICRFIALQKVAHETNAAPFAPEKLKGATAKGSLEDLITVEGQRLQSKGLLALGRYPVASVMMKGSKFPMQVPSLPDYEGVFPSGRQFLIEVKVCTQPSFRIQKDKIKHKQVQHMLNRSDFNVPGYVLIHFNAREGATFYDPAFTVAVPVRRAKDGGWPVWEEFAACKDKKKEFPSLTRELARQIGVPVGWHTPKQCRSLRPDLLGFLTQQEVLDQDYNVYLIK